jgi:hypothetical protein
LAIAAPISGLASNATFTASRSDMAAAGCAKAEPITIKKTAMSRAMPLPLEVTGTLVPQFVKQAITTFGGESQPLKQ